MSRAELPERLETERLVLRVRTVADAEDIHTYASLPDYKRSCRSLYCVQNSGPDTPK